MITLYKSFEIQRSKSSDLTNFFVVYYHFIPEHIAMRVFSLIIFMLLTGCATDSASLKSPAPPLMKMTENNPNKWTGLTRQNLNHLFQIYNLSPYIFTHEIIIESKVIPHSHPILTLNTRYAEKPQMLLAVFLHEQLHWWTEIRKESIQSALIDIKQLFPSLPNEGVAKDQSSTYLHFLICFLEYDALIDLVTKKEADKIINELIEKDKIYPWIYSQVLLKFKEINAIIERNNLRPLTKI
jgi:hypothetical protein